MFTVSERISNGNILVVFEVCLPDYLFHNYHSTTHS